MNFFIAILLIYLFFFFSGKPELTNGLPEAEAVRK